ncbi:MAG: PD-(D/E)XK nuclease family protein [Pseudomonadota bacterium]|nr:PD-(D/E)XK nuclease family protein [Pseudomonadota bacterium]
MPQQRRLLSRPELFDLLAQGLASRLTVLTPNTRLAQALAGDFDRAQQAASRAHWETADILPFDAFVARLWEDALYSPRGASLPLLLSPIQELAAWEDAVRASGIADPVFSAPAAAVQCREAWKLSHAWHVGLRRAEPANEDQAAWLDWASRYERVVKGHTDGARLPDVVGRSLDLGTPKPVTIALAGFDIVTPQMSDFLNALSAAGCEVCEVAPLAIESTVVRIELTQSKDEIEAAAAWARARLSPSPLGEGRGEGQPRIGIVVPDLARSRARVARAFAAALKPAHALTPGPLPFDISLGEPLSGFPLVGDALRLLELAGPAVPFEHASRLVRSPFIGGAESEIDVRARLDAWLRERSGPRITLDQLLRLAAAAQGCRADRLLDLLAALAAARKASLFGAKGAAEWAKAFSEALRAAGFPGERTLDSIEYQALQRWHTLLAEFGSLERVTGKMGYAEACRRLARIADAAIFQPESPEAPIRILGVLESAGLEFDHLWVMGLTADAWPLPARPNPFLPMRAQRAAGIPQADPRASLELDRRITSGWRRSAPEVVFSHARAEGEAELAPSPLIADVAVSSLEALGVAAPATLRAAIRRGGRVETLDDASAPPIAQAEQRGGTGLFRDQAACPFRGYARRRVAAKPLEVPRLGLDPRDRGNLLHAMLAEVWRELADSAALHSSTSVALRELLDRAAKLAIADVKRKRGDALSGRFERLECDRLVRLAADWLVMERARPDFQVLATEDERPLTFGGVTVKARLDRMDALARGRAIIDYKTGECATSSWLGERPEEPQLPMYALAGMDVSVVAFGQVKVGKMGFKGIAREKDLVPGANLVTDDRSRAASKYRDWAELVEGWRLELERIGRGFATGDARVDPKRGPLTCVNCDQHMFCRIAEKAAFGVRKGDAADE